MKSLVLDVLDDDLKKELEFYHATESFHLFLQIQQIRLLRSIFTQREPVNISIVENQKEETK